MLERIQEAAGYIADKIHFQPEIALILGSGLGALAEEIEEAVVIAYGDIPGFPVTTVVGHSGCLVCGLLEGKKVVAMQGRFHYYEGHDLAEVTFPVRVMKALGVQCLIVSNAAGGINRTFQPGDLMLMTDHINFLGSNPLRGPNEETLGPRFPDLSEAYSVRLRDLAKTIAREEKMTLREGVYCATSGPCYETPAEIRFFAAIGADAVGMSTVPEVIVARHAGLEVLGISCITNPAAGISMTALHHTEVVAAGIAAVPQFICLVRQIIRRM